MSPGPEAPVSARNRLPALSKANPLGKLVSPVAKTPGVPVGVNLRISPLLSVKIEDTKRLPDASKVKAEGPSPDWNGGAPETKIVGVLLSTPPVERNL